MAKAEIKSRASGRRTLGFGLMRTKRNGSAGSIRWRRKSKKLTNTSFRRRCKKLFRYRFARNGRLVLCRRSFVDNLRQAEFSHSRFDRSGADQNARKSNWIWQKRFLSSPANQARRWSRTLSNNIFSSAFPKKSGEKTPESNLSPSPTRIRKCRRSPKPIIFAKSFSAIAEIGGRFSALSPFGMAAGAAMDLDVEDFLKRAQEMVEACQIKRCLTKIRARFWERFSASASETGAIN